MPYIMQVPFLWNTKIAYFWFVGYAIAVGIAKPEDISWWFVGEIK